MRPARSFLWVIPFLLSFLIINAGEVSAAVSDDYVPEVTARVARISFARGDVQIRRIGSRDWERAALNLPIVEGDEITTGGNSRLEIQFDSRNFLRLAENSYLKITTLKDEGIAASLSQGSLSLRVLQFDKSNRYFEVDAPQTTVAVELAGMYRIDAGDARKQEVRVAVTDGGEARLYSENSGFTLRNGRSARIFLEGNNIGEWETTDASRYADDFDSWTLERDAVIAKRLQNADYDKYYDRDVYGAEDLNENGEWIYTKKYGYVWRPFPSAISSYANWSPYRYGHWRWIPPYGWTWVNDEPWGWATYHHGRWVYDSGNWYWTPYAYYRARRNWWQPALVIVTYAGSSICWYPLPYDYGYYNYNNYSSIYIDRSRTTIINNRTIIVNPTPTPAPTGTGNGNNSGRFERKPPVFEVPATGVVAVEAGNFGTTTGGFKTAPPDVAKRVLSKTPFETEDAPRLPNYNDLSGKINREIVVENSANEKIRPQVQTGAGERNGGGSIDENLRKQRIYGNRLPVERTPPTDVKEDNGSVETRKTGAVRRLPPSEIGNGSSSETQEKAPDNFPIRSRGGKNQNRDNNTEPPVYEKRNKNIEREQTPPASEPTQREERTERRQKPPDQEPPRVEQPPQRIEPRAEPPQREKPPQQESRPPQPQREEKPPPQERKVEQSPPAKEREREKTVDKDG
ncbi:MAG: FecR domain-containing protein [Acidobacteriota bacterium]|nr:FecR domain-containing protein [Acidobacteriota bacterium]